MCNLFTFLELHHHSVDSIVGIIGVFCAFIAAWRGYRKWKTNLLFQKNKIMNEMINQIREDEDIAYFIYKMIEYGQGWYGKSFHNSDDERKVDKALFRYSFLIELFDDDLIGKKQFNKVRYELDQIVQHHDVQDYLFNLRKCAFKENATFQYDSLVQYGRKYGFLPEDFFDMDNKSQKYSDVL